MSSSQNMSLCTCYYVSIASALLKQHEKSAEVLSTATKELACVVKELEGDLDTYFLTLPGKT